MTSVYFWCEPQGEREVFQHQIVCLAEGLKELGITVSSNVPYWRLHPDRDEYLFTPTLEMDDCDIVVVNCVSFALKHAERVLRLDEATKSGRTYKLVYMRLSSAISNWDTRSFTNLFDLVTICHSNRGEMPNYPPNGIPWAFGLDNRIIEATKDGLPFEEREWIVERNYRFDHGVRRWAENTLFPMMADVLPSVYRCEGWFMEPEDPYHLMQFWQCGQRHHPDYYARLKSSVASATFCGSWHQYPVDSCYQWGGWRFWEVPAAGCVSMHIDLEKYGAALPVMPENWEHYIGFDMSDPQAGIDRITPELLKHIGKAGHDWALEHYAPVPTAKRFLEALL